MCPTLIDQMCPTLRPAPPPTTTTPPAKQCQPGQEGRKDEGHETAGSGRTKDAKQPDQE